MTVGVAQDEREEGGWRRGGGGERERGMCMKKKRGRRQESLAGHPVVTQGKAVVDAEKNITTRKRKNQEKKTQIE